MSSPVRPTIRPWSRPSTPVLTADQSRAVDARAMDEFGVPQDVLMERAGAAAAQVIQHLHPHGPVLALAGKGNNGGDVLVAARTLATWGRQVSAVVTDPAAVRDELRHGWAIPVLDAATADDAALADRVARVIESGGVVLDGILGTGVTGAPRGEALRLIRAVEQGTRQGAGVVAMDVPSGVDATSGAVPGSAVTAEVTVSFGWPCMGSLLHPGRARSGRVVAVEIGFPPPAGDEHWAYLLTPAWAEAIRPARPPVTHKNAVGALAVVAGSPGMAGAAILAARAALRSGAGYVRIVSPGENRSAIQSALPEAVFVDAGDESAVNDALEASRAVAVGPAMGTDERARQLLQRILTRAGEHARPVVVDADALTLLARSRGRTGGEVSTQLGPRTVITPHPGEARRLLGAEELPGDRWAVARSLHEWTLGTVVLKGTPTLVHSAGGAWVDSVGNSDLAVAGMGDTLTGAIGAFLAQGLPPHDAAGLGLVSTGRAAARAAMGPGLQAADVPDHIPGALTESMVGTAPFLPGILLDLDPAR